MGFLDEFYEIPGTYFYLYYEVSAYPPVWVLKRDGVPEFS